MKLIGFEYEENQWRLEPTRFNLVNLVVGKNAVGKSRTLYAISYVAGFMSDKMPIPDYKDIKAKLTFEEGEHILVYNFVREDGTIISEQLDILNERTIIRRDDSSAIIDNESINPPQNKLVLNIRRDIQKYPEIEKIMTWANNVVTVSFTKFDPIFPIFSQSSNPFELAKIVQELDDVSKKEFYNLVHEIGFELSSVKVLKGAQIVLFKEKGVDTILLENDLSNGMLRSISVLLYMIYFKMTGYPALLLIDDLCEGLDYDHSVKLGRKIFEFCSSNDIQLIATSNDAFLMDIVDIDNWCVLRRNGSSIVPLCRYDNTELFDHFALTGLSNFDFFASDYIDTYLRDTSKK